MKRNLEIKLKNKWPSEWYSFFWGNQILLRERALKLEEGTTKNDTRDK